MNANYIVGAILIAFGIAVLSQTGLLTSSQTVYYPFVGTSLFIIGTVLCYVEYTSGDLKISGLKEDVTLNCLRVLFRQEQDLKYANLNQNHT